MAGPVAREALEVFEQGRAGAGRRSDTERGPNDVTVRDARASREPDRDRDRMAAGVGQQSDDLRAVIHRARDRAGREPRQPVKLAHQQPHEPPSRRGHRACEMQRVRTVEAAVAAQPNSCRARRRKLPHRRSPGVRSDLRRSLRSAARRRRSIGGHGRAAGGRRGKPDHAARSADHTHTRHDLTITPPPGCRARRQLGERNPKAHHGRRVAAAQLSERAAATGRVKSERCRPVVRARSGN
jgi:hypothetical protein